jgi:hypothetical protein
MKTNISFLISLLISQLLFSCKDQPTSPESLDDLHLTFLSGYIWADLMPAIPPADPVVCQIIFVAENRNQTKALDNLSVPQADVFLNSSNQKLGTITFTTSWDGKLEPAELDTVRITRVVGQTSPFSVQCDKYVYLNIIVQNDPKNSIICKTDSLLFGCVY